MNTIAALIAITNIGFTAVFDTDAGCPAWVAYDLEPCEVVNAQRIPMRFRADGRIPDTDYNADYRASGFDKGHLAPAADFNWNTNALAETYLFSNVCPQLPSVNRGEWRRIEYEIRALAKSGTVHVVTFPHGFTTNRIGRVAVPASFVKVAYGNFGAKMWIVSNELNHATLPRSEPR